MNRKQRRAAAKARRRDIPQARGSASEDSKLEASMSYHRAGRLAEAKRLYAEILSREPNHVVALHLLGVIKAQEGNAREAAELIGMAIALRPEYAEAHNNLGNVLIDQGGLDEAVAAFHTALELKPDLAEAHNNLGNALKDQGKLDEAVAAYHRALELKPDYAEAHSNLLFTLNYHPALSREDIFAEHQRWNERHARDWAPRIPVHANPRDPDRRLRVGYVSPDFETHPCHFFVEPLLERHDRTALEIFAYAQVIQPDDVTKRMKGLVDCWRSTVDASDEDVAAWVREDGIDILVDLAGHTKGNRLLVFARKPAPLQVAYIGYCNTSGLKTIDYRLTDARADPEGQDTLYTEELVRLPRCFLCYAPFAGAPEVEPLPATKAGHITFGSFNNLAKVTPEVIALWSEVLAAVPSARLVLKAKSLYDTTTRERYAALFEENGVARDRIEFIAHIPSLADHLALYGRIDIALDTFPYNGTTTTCEAMWMGVPVITLAGRVHAGRVGVSLLSAVGQEAMIAETLDDYVALATRLAGDLDRLSALRTDLRSRMAASPLCDQAGLARAVESAYRTMWQRWCDGRDASARLRPRPSE